MAELAPRVIELARRREGARPQLHDRCRGGRPARTVARCDRRACCGDPSLARLGRLRPRGAGLSEARAAGDRLDRGCGAGDRTAAHGAPGQGRLLGHRDQARAGARARRLSGVHPQGDDRPLLHGLRAQAAGARARVYPAIRHPQCAHRRERRSRTPAASRATNSSACTAWARRSTRRCIARTARRRLPRLCAGRRPPRSARLSGAAAAGERRELLLRVCRGRFQVCRSAISCAGRRAGSATRGTRGIRKFRCRRDLYVPERRNSMGVEFGDCASLAALLAEVRAAMPVRCRSGAAGRRHRPCRHRACGASRRSTARSIGHRARGRRRDRARRDGRGAAPALPPGMRRRSTSAPRRSIALPISSGRKPRAPDRAAAGRGRQDARRCAFRSARGRRLLPLLRARGAARRWRRSRCPGRPARANELRYRGRGVFVCISPWNFPLAIFTGQVIAALAAGNAVVAKPAEQTPLVAAEAVRLFHDAGIPATALHLVPGDGTVGASLVADRRVAGVAFTGSTEVARADQPHARRQGRPDRAADRRDRRHQRHDRRCHRAARAGHRRRDRLGLPLRRPALLGAAAALPAGRRRRPHASTW